MSSFTDHHLLWQRENISTSQVAFRNVIYIIFLTESSHLKRIQRLCKCSCPNYISAEFLLSEADPLLPQHFSLCIEMLLIQTPLGISFLWPLQWPIYLKWASSVSIQTYQKNMSHWQKQEKNPFLSLDFYESKWLSESWIQCQHILCEIYCNQVSLELHVPVHVELFNSVAEASKDDIFKSSENDHQIYNRQSLCIFS